jgi:hypothetical protein
MANNLRTELVLDALEMAVGQRRPHMSFIIRTRGSNIRLWRLAVAAEKSAFGHPWVRSVTRTIMPCARASSRRSSASSSLAGNSRLRLGQGSPASAISKASTIRPVCIQPSDTSRPSALSSRPPTNSPRPRSRPSLSTVHEGGAIPQDLYTARCAVIHRRSKVSLR